MWDFKKRFILKNIKRDWRMYVRNLKTDVYCCNNWLFGNITFVKNSIEIHFSQFWEKSLPTSGTPKHENVGLWRSYRMRSTSTSSQPWLSESIVVQPLSEMGTRLFGLCHFGLSHFGQADSVKPFPSRDYSAAIFLYIKNWWNL